jgi:murein DD-endopeptidase MepM/ murein hydrolase activator NlpD
MKLVRDETDTKPRLVFEQSEEKPRQTLIHKPLVADKSSSSFSLSQQSRPKPQTRTSRVSEQHQEEGGLGTELARKLRVENLFVPKKEPDSDPGPKVLGIAALAVGVVTPLGVGALVLILAIGILLVMSSLRFAFGFKDPNAETASLMTYFTQESAGLVWNYLSLDGGRYFPGYGGSLDEVRVSTNYDQTGQTQYKRQVELMGLIFAQSLFGVNVSKSKDLIREIVEDLYTVTYSVENRPYYTVESRFEEVDGKTEEIRYIQRHDYYILTAFVSEGNFSNLIQSRINSITDLEEKELAEVRMDLFKENLGLEQFIDNPLGPGNVDWRNLITSVTGYRLLYGGLEMHSGLDLGVSEGTPIYAPGSGEVSSTGYNDSSGNYIEIVMKDGGSETVYVTYMHLSSIDVSSGQVLSEGQVIGLSGNTGRSTGPHLHIQAVKGASVLNPLFLIKLPEKE